MKFSGKGVGGFLKGVRARLLKAGIAAAQIDVISAAIVNRPLPHRLVKLPRAIVKKVGFQLAKSDRAVIVRGRQGFKVYSLEGYESQRQSARVNKPWLETKNAIARAVVANA